MSLKHFLLSLFFFLTQSIGFSRFFLFRGNFRDYKMRTLLLKDWNKEFRLGGEVEKSGGGDIHANQIMKETP